MADCLSRYETMDATVVIRNAERHDIPALSELAIKTYTDAFGHTFSDADLAAHVKAHLLPSHFSQILDEDLVLVAEVGDLLVGYLQVGPADPSASESHDQELRRF